MFPNLSLRSLPIYAIEIHTAECVFSNFGLLYATNQVAKNIGTGSTGCAKDFCGIGHFSLVREGH